MCYCTQLLLCYILHWRAIYKCNRLRVYIRRGDSTEGFLCYEFEGLIFGEAYTWLGLFSEFYGAGSTPTTSSLLHVCSPIEAFSSRSVVSTTAGVVKNNTKIKSKELIKSARAHQLS